MSFTATPVDGSSTPIPMSSVVPDGTNTPIALEGGPSLSSGGNTLAPASIYVKDGNNLVEGATTDAAVTGDNNGSLSAKLRGLTKILADVWDSANHWLQVRLNASNSGGAVPYHNLSAASTNFTNVKGAACQIYGCDLSNTSASIIFVKFYDKATAPATTDVPKRTIQVPANGTVIRAFPIGVKFANGFGWAATGAVADNDNTAIAANCVIDFDLSN